MKGPTAEALKRFCARLGLIDWVDFDQHYNAKLEVAMRRGQKAAKISPTGQYGKDSWMWVRTARVPKGKPREGEYALDQYGRWLIQDEAGKNAESTEEEKVQKALSEFGYQVIRYEARIGYDQYRPGDVTVDPGQVYESDCSLTVIQAFNYAARKTGVKVPDPSRQNYTGYGNTDQYEDDWPKVGSPFRVGDLAHFHSERHVMYCIKAGNIDTAEWCSHGRTAGPELIRLRTYSRFPNEYLFTVRPPLTPPTV